MKAGSSQIRGTKRARQGTAGRRSADTTHRRAGRQAEARENAAMEPEAISRRIEAVQPHPLAELLACPAATGNLLNGAAQCLDFDTGRQSSVSPRPAGVYTWWFRVSSCGVNPGRWRWFCSFCPFGAESGAEQSFSIPHVPLIVGDSVRV